MINTTVNFQLTCYMRQYAPAIDDDDWNRFANYQ